MIQNDFFNNKECYVIESNDKYNNYHNRDGAEFLAKSFFSYLKYDVFSAPESNVIDFAIRKNKKFYTVQVKGSSFRKDKEVYEYEKRRKNISYKSNGDRVLSNWQEYAFEDIQIFAFVANDIQKILLQFNDTKKNTQRLTRQDFIDFEKNKEFLTNQIIKCIDEKGL